jgi:hypothetical protein
MLDFNLDLPEDFFPGYGYGVSLYPNRMTNGALAWGHTGNAYHISTSAYLPDYDVTITILLNSQDWTIFEKGLAAFCKVIMEYY